MQSASPSTQEVPDSVSLGQRRTQVLGPCIEHLQNRIQGAHFQTLSTSPTILHWNSKLGDLSPWKWPVEPGTGRRVAPSDLESHRRTHHFQAPSCLCAHLDRQLYTESRIGVVHVPIKLAKVSPLSGAADTLVRESAILLPPPLIRLDVPLPLESLAYNSGVGGQAGLLHVMPTQVVPLRAIKGLHVEETWCHGPSAQKALAMMKEGISEELFYSLFIRCYMCEAVVLKSRFPQDHRCPRKLRHEYGEGNDHRQVHLLSAFGQEDGVPTDVPTDVDTDIDAEKLIDLREDWWLRSLRYPLGNGFKCIRGLLRVNGLQMATQKIHEPTEPRCYSAASYVTLILLGESRDLPYGELLEVSKSAPSARLALASNHARVELVRHKSG
ncbi:hypothetical protein BKA70DRAFT_1240910 [Coprinopsis sp. MPI-PUGE-AT-0042]|nr:hypothetical protein BKA70DRAFT_1240910 [Coprinopsis sp. MPI-PUGE-AT-0042]